MGRLRELTYREVIARLRQLGFRFIVTAKVHTSCGCATVTAKLFLFLTTPSLSARARCAPLSGKWASVSRSSWISFSRGDE